MTPEIQKLGADARSKYSDEQREFVKAGWAAGKSSSVLAQDMFTAFGLDISRNCIIGLVSRMKLPSRPAGAWRYVKNNKPCRKPRPPEPKPAPPRPDLEQPLAVGPIGDFPAQGLCKWPVQDLPDFQCCGQPQFGRGPYCEHHSARRKGTQPRVAGTNIRVPF